MKTPERLIENAQRLNQDYDHANQILQAAIKDAMPWAGALVMRGSVPTIDKIERLCTQCLAILMATYPEDFEKPIKGFGSRA